MSVMRLPADHAIIGSMLWAAFGDALGFMSELVDTQGLRARTGQSDVTRLVPWRYRSGGKFGTTVRMPEGAYSDDTQLRLATARAIGARANFDVDSFSKIELPAWLAYHLGAGRGSRAAAANLARSSVRWFGNFYTSKEGTSYIEGGGNGAAMRIQPHVLAASTDAHDDDILLDVARNTACTHGHPRAFVGTALYALVLRETLQRGVVPSIRQCRGLLDAVRHVPRVLQRDDHLAAVWLPEWSRQAGENFAAAYDKTIAECVADLAQVEAAVDMPPELAYMEIVRTLGGLNPKERGSGTRSVIAALALAWLFRENPLEGLLSAANVLGSDTDTIASMAGGVMGAVYPEPPPGEVLDAAYIREVGHRLFQISVGKTVEDHPYPSLLTWTPPRSAIDTVGRHGDDYAIAGLGPLSFSDSEVYKSAEKQPLCWRWAKLRFGQSVLVRMRETPPNLEDSSLPLFGRREPRADLPKAAASDRPERAAEAPHQEQPPRPPASQREPPNSRNEMSSAGAGAPEGGKGSERLGNDAKRNPLTTSADVQPSRVPRSLDELTNVALRSDFDAEFIGVALLDLALQQDGIERAIAFAAIVAKSYRARRRRGE